jgi:uncharacterized protein YjbI with pentapeptide repeats
MNRIILSKSLVYSLILWSSILTVSGQVTQKIGGNLGSIDPKAVLELESTTKGFLLPRMTAVQVAAITNPTSGMIVFCTDCGVGSDGELRISYNGVWQTFKGNLNGNITGNAATVTTNANLTGPITSSGNTTSVASQTGTGSTFVMNTSPTLVTPVLGAATATSINSTTIPTSKTLVVTTDKLNVMSSTSSSELAGVISDETGTGSVVMSASPTFTGDAKATTATAGDNDVSIATTEFVTSAITTANATNANLTGPITSSGNTTSVASQTGTGSKFVMDNSPTLVTPVLGAATATSINSTTIPTSKTLVVTTDKLNVMSSTSSTELAGVISDETGTGSVVLSDSPTFTGTVSGIDKTMVGLNNVDNTTDLLKPISTATQTALDLKANIASPTFTGDAKATTATAGDNDVSIATTEFVTSAITTANATNANLTGPITSSGNTTSVASQTGTGSTFVMNTSPTLVTPELGAATGTSLSVSGQLTSTVATGTAPLVVTSTTPVANLNIGGNAATVTTNANLTGPITSSGNTTSVASQTGTGSTFVMNTSPTLVTPVLGAATATSINSTTIPTSKTLVVTTDKLNVMSSTSSTELAGVISDETGTGSVVLSDSPTFTGTVSGIDKTMVGLNNVDNTTDLLKPISTATQTALDLKANIASPTFTGDAKATTATAGDNDVSIATTEFVTSAITTANATNANLMGPITSSGNTTSVASQTGTGSKFVMDNSPTLVTPVLGAATATSINSTTIPTSKTLVVTTDKLNVMSSTSSTELAGVISDETGTGSVVMSNSPTLSGTPLAPTPLATSNSTQIATTEYVTNAISVATIPDATTSAKGKLQLAGDLTGTADAPLVAANAITTAKILDANVTNAKLDKANIPLSGFGAATANVALGSKKLTGVGNPTAAQDAATKAYVDSTVSTTNTNVTALSTLDNGKIYLGNASNQATEVTVSGDVTMTNAGVVSIGTDKVVTSMLATNAVTTAKITDANVTNAKLDKANIPLSGFGAATANVALGSKKLTGVGNPTAAQDAATKAYVDSTVSTTNTNVTALSTLDNGKIYLGNASNQATEVTVSGDVTMTNAGVVSIGTDKVVTSMLATNAVTTAKITDANVTTAKLADAAVTTVKITDANVTTAKLADANVTNAKLDKANIPLSGFGAATANVALGSKKLTGVGNPTAAQDAATKAYVDSTVSTTNTNVTALSTLDNGKIYLGNASNQATEVTVSGDVTMTNAGVVSIGTDKVVTSMLATNAVTTAKITDANVTTAKLADAAVTTVKITDANVTTAKLADANVTNAKLDKANIPLSGFGAATANVALGSKKLTGVGNPTAAQDAATKAYVDSTVSTTNTNVTALSTLDNGKIYLGNASNQATEVTVSGDVTMTNAGVVSIGTDKVVTSMLATNAVTTAKITDANVTNAKLDKANIPLSGFGAATANVALGSKKLTGVGNPTAAQDAATKAYVDSTVSTTNTNVTALSTLDNGKIYLGNASNQATEVTVSGDVTMTNAGVVSIGTDKVVTSMLATNAVTTAKITDANITTAKLADAAVTTVKITDANVTTAKLADANVTNAKLDKANIPLSGFGAATANVALGSKKLTGVGNPTAAQDAATKAYVDSTVSTTNTNVTALSTLADGKIYASNQATELP